MTTFRTREVEIPASPEGSPPEENGFLSGKHSSPLHRPASNHSSGQHTSLSASSASALPILPALPPSLLEALSREPPPMPASSSQGKDWTNIVTSTSPQSRTSVSFSRSPSLGGMPLPQSSTSTNLSDQASPLLHSPAAAFPVPISPPLSTLFTSSQSAPNEFGTAPQPPIPPPAAPVEREGKRSMWRAVGFGRSRSSETSSANSASSSRSGWSSRLANSSASSRMQQAPPQSQHLASGAVSPSLPRSPSSSRIRPSPGLSSVPQHASKSNANKWLFEAQSATAGLTPAARKNSIIGLGLQAADDAPSVLPVQGGGRGLDAELDAMDHDPLGGLGDEDDEDDREEDAASPWTGAGGRRGPQYTHDLGKGLRPNDFQSDAEEEDEDESEAEEEMDSKNDATPVQGSASIFERRRPSEAVHLAEPSAVEKSEETSSTAPPEQLAPSLQGEDAFKSANWSEGDSTFGSGSGGEGGLTGVVEQHKLTQLRLATPEYVVAVVGPRNVGKSTVIRRGLYSTSIDAPVQLFSDANGNRATSCKANYRTGGSKGTLQILEIDSALLDYNAEGVVWPKDLVTPDSIMLCYDASDSTAFEPLTRLLQAFWERGFEAPLLVLACKAHPNPDKDAVDPNKVADMCNVYGAGIVSLAGGVKDQKMKDAFKYVLMRMRENRGEPPRRPSSSSASSGTEPPSRRGSSATSPALTTASPFENPFANISLPPRAGGGSSSLGLEVVQEAPVGEQGQTAEEDQLKETLEEFKNVVQHEEDVEENAGDVDQPGSPTMVFPSSPDQGNDEKRKPPMSLDLHFSRDDMVDKFLFAAVTGNDEQYVTLFLIVYRRFARPYDVVSKLIERFEFVAGRLKTDPLLSRFAQMKLCGVLATWFHYYPGDFSSPSTLGLLQPFLEGLLPRGATWVAHYAAELIPLLGVVSTLPDPEAAWAIPDKPSDQQPLSYLRRPSLAPSYDSTSSVGGSHHSFDENTSRVGPGHSQSHDHIPSLSNLSSSFTPDGRRRSNSDAATSDSNDRTSSSIASLRKARAATDMILLDLSNALLELPEEVIAQQITRIAWAAFSEMTPRDLLRHVLAPRDLKNPRAIHRNMDSNVMQSINFVNYLSDWVATMVLIQSKLKWRARMLEKFIAVASALRKMDNFDSLMGVLAGINCQPIWRLTETMETISLKLEGDRAKLPKRLRSLNKLMAKTKSFSAYRLALATSGADMLPYLGVHLQEITLTNEVKSDMRDGKVNWTKFSQMARSAAIVLDCSRQTPAYLRDHQVERCIKDVPLLSTERQYDLSYEYQPRQAIAGSRIRRLVGKVGDSLGGGA